MAAFTEAEFELLLAAMYVCGAEPARHVQYEARLRMACAAFPVNIDGLAEDLGDFVRVCRFALEDLRSHWPTSSESIEDLGRAIEAFAEARHHAPPRGGWPWQKRADLA